MHQQQEYLDVVMVSCIGFGFDFLSSVLWEQHYLCPPRNVGK